MLLPHHYVELFTSEHKCPGAASAGDRPEGSLTSFAAKLAANVRLLQIPYATRDSMVCSASVPARQKEESAGNLLASLPVLSDFLTATAVTKSANFHFGGMEEHASLGRAEVVTWPCFETTSQLEYVCIPCLEKNFFSYT